MKVKISEDEKSGSRIKITRKRQRTEVNTMPKRNRFGIECGKAFEETTKKRSEASKVRKSESKT